MITKEFVHPDRHRWQSRGLVCHSPHWICRDTISLCATLTSINIWGDSHPQHDLRTLMDPNARCNLLCMNTISYSTHEFVIPNNYGINLLISSRRVDVVKKSSQILIIRNVRDFFEMRSPSRSFSTTLLVIALGTRVLTDSRWFRFASPIRHNLYVLTLIRLGVESGSEAETGWIQDFVTKSSCESVTDFPNKIIFRNNIFDLHWFSEHFF